MRHDAFLSYSHTDAVIARELERGLEKLAKPLLKLRALDVFRDETALASSPALWPSIVQHLAVSEWLLLLASTHSAASPWCAKELEWWLENRSSERLLLLVTDGEIVWNPPAQDFDHQATTALCPALYGKFAAEPLYTDLRWAQGQPALSLNNPRFRDAVLNVAAPLRGIPKDELDGADVRQLRRNRRFVRALFAAIGAAAVLAGWQWRAAVRQRDVAERQARVAMSRKLVADSRLPEYSLDVSLLLAAEGYQIAPTRDAHENLIRLAHDNDRFLQFLQAGEPITALGVPPKRLRIVAGDKDGRVWMWGGTDNFVRVDYRRFDAEGPASGAPIESLAVDEAGDRATSIDAKGRIFAFTLADDGIRRQAIEGCPAAEGARVRLNAHGNRLAVRSEDGRVTLWTITGARCSLAARLDGDVGQYFALSPSGNYFAVSERSGGATWWDLNGRTGRVVPSDLNDGFLAYFLQFDNDDKRLAIADNYRLAVWNLEAGRRGRQMLATAIDGQFSTMAFSDGGDKLAIGMQDGTVDVWRFGPDAPVREHLRGHRYGFHVTQLTFNETGTMLASAAEDGLVMLWYFGYTGRDKPLARELRGHAYRVQLLTFHPFAWLVSAAGSGAIVWTAAVTSDLPFLSHLGRNEGIWSSFFDPVNNITIALPGIVLRDVDKDGCRLVEEARARAGRTLTAGELTAAVGDLQYSPTCPRRHRRKSKARFCVPAPRPVPPLAGSRRRPRRRRRARTIALAGPARGT